MRDTLRVGAVNVQGLRTAHKRIRFFQTFLSSYFQILLISDTHCRTPEEADLWTRELVAFRCQGLFAAENPTAIIWKDSAGIGPPLAVNPFTRFFPPPHRTTDMVISLNDVPTHLMAVYAPVGQSERIDFFELFYDQLDTIHYRQHIWGGDWNCVLEDTLDSTLPPSTLDPSRVLLDRCLQAVQASDSYRMLYPTARGVTNFMRANVAERRLDRIYLTGPLQASLSEADVHVGMHLAERSTHCPVSVAITLVHSRLRDRTTFKLGLHTLAIPWVQEYIRGELQAFVPQASTASGHWSELKRVLISASRQASHLAARMARRDPHFSQVPSKELHARLPSGLYSEDSVSLSLRLRRVQQQAVLPPLRRTPESAP
ncbi:Endonuclease/exonuclease/phosphatase, partial [Lipomyces kononenkoae]